MISFAKLADGRRQKVDLRAWRKQPVDVRDLAYAVKFDRKVTGNLKSQVDLRKICSPIENQGSLGSCTAQAFAALVEANELRRNFPEFDNSALGILAQPLTGTPKFTDASRLFHYYATRLLETNVNADTGATMRGTIKAGAKYGVIDEPSWPYDISKYKTRPPEPLWTKAASAKIESYHAIADGDLETMKAVLLGGYLVCFGFRVYGNFMSSTMAKTGLLTRPSPYAWPIGGHAVVLVGFDDNKIMPDKSKGAFLVRNSWGTNWGLAGYFWMAYNYVGDKKLAQDFWVVKSAPL